MFLKRVILILLFLASWEEGYCQVRFYFQYRGIPFYKGGATDFSVLSGVKLDPNKELVLGIGLTGRFVPQELEGDLKFDKNTFSLGFNYYLSRRFYVGVDAALNQLRAIVEDNTLNDETLTGKFFLDYQFTITYVVLRRLHFSIATGIVDLTRLAVQTTANVIEKQQVTPDLALALRVYVCQIKF
jgi:hypothetical protein